MNQRTTRSWRLTPVRLVALGFFAVIVLGTGLLMLPIAHPGEVQPLAAAFTAVSATCITGLTVVDTATYWTPFGKAVIMLLTQMGGFGIMSAATLLALAVKGRIDLSDSLVAHTEKQTRSLGETGRIIKGIAALMFGTEFVLGVWLTGRFLARGLDFVDALLHGFFYACMGFTNAGFAVDSNNLVGYVSDQYIMWPLFIAIIIGSLGYPVIFELSKKRRPDAWSVHTRLTLYGFMLLLVLGATFFAFSEWSNPATLGPLDTMGKTNATLAGSIMPRSAGFNVIDYAEITDETTLMTIILMFIGGGSAGTSGGLKVSTFFLLAFVILSEVRGEPEVTVAHRSINQSTVRQAIVVALLSVGAVVSGVTLLIVTTDLPPAAIFFDVTSAFATCGLSLGITPELPASGQMVLMVLMYVGRIGTVTVASALALRARTRRYRLPDERPIIG